jgi:succinoglycan biosynthesis protein ExoM
MNISVCIATYRRPGRLADLLGDIARQQLLPAEVVVVDNDPAGSARATVDGLRPDLPFALAYAIQPERSIALTRNLTVRMARGDWIAFIDDDERAPPAWLHLMAGAAGAFHADGVLAPVVPVVPDGAPSWIRRGSFYEGPRMASGGVVPLNWMRIGNALVRGDILRAEAGPFDPAWGLRTGEDGDMLGRLVHRGAKIVWCDEAAVDEPVEAGRLSLRWILQRAFSGGQDFARKTLTGHYGRVSTVHRVLLFLRAAAQMVVALGLSLLLAFAGRHHGARWLATASANLGKLSIYFDFRYEEYA